MPTFEFKARTPAGDLESGHVQAATRSAAAAQLQSQGLIVTQVAATRDRSATPPLGSRLFRRKPKSVDIEVGLQQLALLLRGGTSLLTALEALRESATSRSMQRVWGEVSTQIQAGERLSTAMEKQKCFPEFTIQLIRVGEQTGFLAPVLTRSAQSMQGRRKAWQEITTLMFYPILVIVMACAVTMYMVVYLIPKLEVYLQTLGKQIPAMTQYLLDGSVWLRTHYLAIGATLALVVMVPWVIASTREGRLWIDRLLLKVPLIGRLYRLADTALTARSLSLLIGSGVPLVESLGITSELLYNRHSGNIVTTARQKIMQGSNLASAIDDPIAFTPMLSKMAGIGEQSGNLEEVLQETAEFHENQLYTMMQRLNSLITPALTLLIGSIVGYVYIAFFVALFAAAS